MVVDNGPLFIVFKSVKFTIDMESVF